MEVLELPNDIEVLIGRDLFANLGFTITNLAITNSNLIERNLSFEDEKDTVVVGNASKSKVSEMVKNGGAIRKQWGDFVIF